jgi:hypothetical protein
MGMGRCGPTPARNAYQRDLDELSRGRGLNPAKISIKGLPFRFHPICDEEALFRSLFKMTG